MAQDLHVYEVFVERKALPIEEFEERRWRLLHSESAVEALQEREVY